MTVNQQADADPHTLRLSIDAKVAVKVGATLEWQFTRHGGNGAALCRNPDLQRETTGCHPN